MKYDDICALYGLYSVRSSTVSGDICGHFVNAKVFNFLSVESCSLFMEVSTTHLGARVWSALA